MKTKTKVLVSSSELLKRTFMYKVRKYFGHTNAPTSLKVRTWIHREIVQLLFFFIEEAELEDTGPDDLRLLAFEITNLAIRSYSRIHSSAVQPLETKKLKLIASFYADKFIKRKAHEYISKPLRRFLDHFLLNEQHLRKLCKSAYKANSGDKKVFRYVLSSDAQIDTFKYNFSLGQYLCLQYVAESLTPGLRSKQRAGISRKRSVTVASKTASQAPSQSQREPSVTPYHCGRLGHISRNRSRTGGTDGRQWSFISAHRSSSISSFRSFSYSIGDLSYRGRRGSYESFDHNPKSFIYLLALGFCTRTAPNSEQPTKNLLYNDIQACKDFYKEHSPRVTVVLSYYQFLNGLQVHPFPNLLEVPEFKPLKEHLLIPGTMQKYRVDERSEDEDLVELRSLQDVTLFRDLSSFFYETVHTDRQRDRVIRRFDILRDYSDRVSFNMIQKIYSGY